ncbi:MAG: response regulator [Bacteroidetes bacterium]|nr:response regulator [Bacteroidota bacterium]
MSNEKNISKELMTKTRILIAEDNLLNQKIAEHLVKGFGFSCDVCSDGKKAIELLKTNPYHLILMDIQMPEMDGYEATEYIRNVLKLNIPIIATTGNSSGSEKGKCIESGMNDYLSKPLKADELYELLTRFLFPDAVCIDK